MRIQRKPSHHSGPGTNWYQLLLVMLGTAFVTRQLSTASGATRCHPDEEDYNPSVMMDSLSLPRLSDVLTLFSIDNAPRELQSSSSLRKPQPQLEAARVSRMSKYNSTYQYKLPEGDWQQPPPECGAAPAFDSFFGLPQSERSRFGEDQIIYRTFFLDKSIVRGNYIELGAFDGRTESNSRFFDLCLGWKGLLIEGNPATFDRMQRARPRAHRMSFAPSCSAEYEAVNKTVQFAKYPMANAGIQGKAKTYDAKPMVAVPCGPLGPVLEDVFGERIHFMSLDVEGAEPMVLRTIDFSKIQIDVLMVEVSNKFCGAVCPSRDETRAIMKAAGYRRYEGLVLASDVYVRPGSGLDVPGVAPVA